MASPKPSEPQARLYLLLEELFNTSVPLHEGVTTRLLTQGTVVGHAEVPRLGGRIDPLCLEQGKVVLCSVLYFGLELSPVLFI